MDAVLNKVIDKQFLSLETGDSAVCSAHLEAWKKHNFSEAVVCPAMCYCFSEVAFD